MKETTVIGVTGPTGSGKNWLCNQLMSRSDKFGMIDADKIAYEALRKESTIHDMLRERIKEVTGTLDPKELGQKSWADHQLMDRLRRISEPVLRLDVLDQLAHMKMPIVLLNAVFLIENVWLPICKYNTVIVQAQNIQIHEWLSNRGLSDEQILDRLLSPMRARDRLTQLKDIQGIMRRGTIWIFNNSDTPTACEEADALCEQLLAFYGSTS
jgi:dephospho-CoA kinase